MADTYDHIITGDNIIADALYLLRVLSPGDAVPSAYSTHALRVLNNLIKALRGAGILTWNQEWITQTLVASSVVLSGGVDYRCIRKHTSGATDEPGVGANWTSYWVVLTTTAGAAWATATSYSSIGNLVLDQNVARVFSAYIRTGTVDTELKIIPSGAFFAIPDKTALLIPKRLWFKRGVANEAFLDPLPNDATTMVVHLLVARHLADFDASSDNPDMVQESYDMLIHALALRLSPVYGIGAEAIKILEDRAQPIFKAALGSDVEMDSLIAPRDTRTRI